MRNMSFTLTIDQMRKQIKTVTRRLGWSDLQVGDVVMAVEKGMGLKKGEKVRRICAIRVISNFPVVLCDISQDEVYREGFPEMSPEQFVDMFCAHNRCARVQVVNRIEFSYV